MPPRYPPAPTWAHDFTSVGVTGTNGKSTTTTYLWAALQAHAAPAGAVTTVETRVGEHVGSPVTGHTAFLEAAAELHRAGGRLLALELTSTALGMGFMAAWPVRVGVFTNLSLDHDDQHESPEHYLASKAQLFVHLPPGGTAVLNTSDPNGALLTEVVPDGVEVRTYGAPWRGAPAHPCDLWLVDAEVTPRGAYARLDGPLGRDLGVELRVQAPGLHFLENAAAALLGAVAIGVDPAVAATAIADRPAPAGRFEIVHDDPRVVVDYAHTPDALRRTLEAARAQCEGELWVIFGAGGDRSRTKRRPLGEAGRLADHVVLTNDNPRGEDPLAIVGEIQTGLGDHPHVLVELDRARAIATALAAMENDDLLVIAGKGHEPSQTIGDVTRPFSDGEHVARWFEKHVVMPP